MSGARSGERRTTLARCRDPGFTPGARDVSALLALWEHTRRATPAEADTSPHKAARLVARALERGDRGVARALLAGWAEAAGEQRAMRLRVLSRISRRIELPELPALLGTALHDPEPRVVREAARAIGKRGEPDAPRYEATLLRVVEQAQLPERRAAVEALGRIGGPRALGRLRALAVEDDELRRRTAEAITLITRRDDRARASRIVLDRALPAPVRVRLRCRGGAAAVVADQAASLLSTPPDVKLAVEHRDDATVGLRWSGRLGELYRVRSALEVALAFPLPPAATLLDRIVEGLRQPDLVEALVAWTDGPPRFRLAFAAGGRHRATRWKVAQALDEGSSPLVNDTRQVTWTIEVDPAHDRLLCLPRGADPRFAYRHADVPAATHPTLAALLAWVGRPRPGELVWDPFCGSGSELVECAMLTEGLHLRGTDIDTEAIAAARQNLSAAPIEPASTGLMRTDALSITPIHGRTGASLILSNPPMGRRVVVGGRGMRRLLDDFVAHAARTLRPGGRMIWLSPAPRATARAGQRMGLEAEDLHAVDMGGFFATPQRLRKPG